MQRYTVPMTILSTVILIACDKPTAIREARRFADGTHPQGGFIDGWNDTQRLNDDQTRIIDMCGFDIEDIQLDELEGTPAHAIEPQCDLNAGEMNGSGTHFAKCTEGNATQWAVFGYLPFGGDDMELLEDYPSRAAAEAAVAALEAGQPLPDPVWPATAPADDLAALLARIVRADAVPDATAFAAAMYDAGEALARLGIDTNPPEPVNPTQQAIAALGECICALSPPNNPEEEAALTKARDAFDALRNAAVAS